MEFKIEMNEDHSGGDYKLTGDVHSLSVGIAQLMLNDERVLELIEKSFTNYNKLK